MKKIFLFGLIFILLTSIVIADDDESILDIIINNAEKLLKLDFDQAPSEIIVAAGPGLIEDLTNIPVEEIQWVVHECTEAGIEACEEEGGFVDFIIGNPLRTIDYCVCGNIVHDVLSPINWVLGFVDCDDPRRLCDEGEKKSDQCPCGEAYDRCSGVKYSADCAEDCMSWVCDKPPDPSVVPTGMFCLFDEDCKASPKDGYCKPIDGGDNECLAYCGHCVIEEAIPLI